MLKIEHCIIKAKFKEAQEHILILKGFVFNLRYEFARKNIAKFIENRDGYKSDKELIHLTNGASDGIQMIMDALIKDKNQGFMIPIP